MELTGEWTIPVGGKWPLEFVWKSDDLPTGVTISSATKSVSPATGLTVGDPVVNAAADGVTFSAEAATAGFYTILIVATRSDTYKNIALGYVTVVAASKATSLASNALISVADLARVLGESVETGLAETVINSVSQEFEDEVDCDLSNDTYTAEALTGNGRSYFYLPRWPVTAVTTVVEDDATLTEDTDFSVDYANGILKRMGGLLWSTTEGELVVTYAAGYESVPADIALACAKQCAVEYQRAKQKSWDETSRSHGDGSVSLVEAGLLPDVRAVLERYQRVEI